MQENRVRALSIWSRKQPPNGLSTNPRCPDGRNTNPKCPDGRNTNPRCSDGQGTNPESVNGCRPNPTSGRTQHEPGNLETAVVRNRLVHRRSTSTHPSRASPARRCAPFQAPPARRCAPFQTPPARRHRPVRGARTAPQDAAGLRGPHPARRRIGPRTSRCRTRKAAAPDCDRLPSPRSRHS